jgi:hypothetical protein
MFNLVFILSWFWVARCYISTYVALQQKSRFFIAIYFDVFYLSYMEKKQVTFRVDPAIIKKIKFLAVEQDRSLTDLFLEAIQDLLKKYKKISKK